MLFHYPHSVILCVVFVQLIANIELADQFSLKLQIGDLLRYLWKYVDKTL
jgi:hypothetical protein